MDIDTLKRRIQEHCTDGLVVVVGSGLSVAEGIPGMWSLARHLLTALPTLLPSDSETVWAEIANDLENDIDLETALLSHEAGQELESLIMTQTASFLLEHERKVIEDVVVRGRMLRFSRLLSVLRKEPSGIPVITTNYDRLIEIAAEQAGVGIDSAFVGHRLGTFDAKRSRMSLCRDVSIVKNKRIRKEYCDHIRLLKPHGSFDWFSTNSGPIRCSLRIEGGQRLIITPGLNKYRSGYDPPFDYHIGESNRAIDKGSRFLIIGYGFNDDHLQTHITPRLKNGDPAVIITRSLSEKAKELLPECSGTVAITKTATGDGTTVHTHNSQHEFPDIDIWDVEHLVTEVWRQ